MSKATEDVEREHIKNNGIRLLYNEHIHQFDVNLFVKGLNSFVFFYLRQCIKFAHLLLHAFNRKERLPHYKIIGNCRD